MLSSFLILDSRVRRKQLQELRLDEVRAQVAPQFSSVSHLSVRQTPNLPCNKLVFIKGKINPLLKEGGDGEGKSEQVVLVLGCLVVLKQKPM